MCRKIDDIVRVDPSLSSYVKSYADNDEMTREKTFGESYKLKY